MNYLKHYNHNHDALGRFASSNTARTIAGNESLIKANRDMSKTWSEAEKYNKKIEKKTDSQKLKILKENRKNATDDDVRDVMEMEIYELEQKMKKKSK